GHGVIHDPDARSHAFGDLLLDVRGRLMRQRLLDVRVHGNRAGEGLSRQRAFFTWLIDLVPGDASRTYLVVEPLVGQALGRLVRIGVRRHADTRVEAVHPVV